MRSVQARRGNQAKKSESAAMFRFIFHARFYGRERFTKKKTPSPESGKKGLNIWT
jgi:hypothetical protein